MTKTSDTAGPGKVIGWEWVQTGPDFALGHPLAQRFGAIWFVIAFIALHAVALVASAIWQILTAGPGWIAILWTILMLILICNDILALAGLLGRHPIAWPTVWIALILSFPLSLPLVVYWADGTRPNLIYRHRFERLVWPDRKAAP